MTAEDRARFGQAMHAQMHLLADAVIATDGASPDVNPMMLRLAVNAAAFNAATVCDLLLEAGLLNPDAVEARLAHLAELQVAYYIDQSLPKESA